MNIHEYQAKAIFADNGIPALKGKVERRRSCRKC